LRLVNIQRRANVANKARSVEAEAKATKQPQGRPRTQRCYVTRTLVYRKE